MCPPVPVTMDDVERGRSDQVRRLADEIQQRRLSLWDGEVTQVEAAKRAGVSDTTWNQLENHRGPLPSPRTRRAVCRVLEWTPDSVDRILRGEDPVAIATGPAATRDRPTLDGLAHRVSWLEREAVRLADAIGADVEIDLDGPAEEE